MKPSPPKPASRREKVVDSMAKKFADHGNVKQIIISHRNKKKVMLKIKRFLIVAAVAVCMLMAGFFAAGLFRPPVPGGKSWAVKGAIEVKNPVDMLKADLDAKVISPDEFVNYCKDYLVRYDSLPDRYKTAFSTTPSSEVYRMIVDVWPMVSVNIRQQMLRELPRIEAEKRRRITAAASSGNQ